MATLYSNDPIKTAGSLTTHDPTVAQGGAPPATTVKMMAMKVQWAWSILIMLLPFLKNKL